MSRRKVAFLATMTAVSWCSVPSGNCFSSSVFARNPTALRNVPGDYYFGNQRVQSNSTFHTALSIVPPLPDWDRLQRARHFADDPVYHQWPPCLRLFHPFQGTALDIAQVVEELDIEPFEITLDTWTIVPHLEILEREFKANEESTPMEDGIEIFDWGEKQRDAEVQELIRQEEEKGFQKMLAREKRRAEKEVAASPNQVAPAMKNKEKKAPEQVAQEQLQQYEEFGGPCILCLEPNEETKQKIADLRDEIAQMIGHSKYSSPSSIYSWVHTSSAFDMGFRPLVPISKFDALKPAFDCAKKLKGLWGDSLTWTVRDFHVLSCVDEDGTSSPNIMPSQYIPTSTDWEKSPWYCNAKIMLMGEEVEQDEEETAAMVDRLVKEGKAGGMDISEDFTILDEEEEDISNIEQWLDDDDFDEGTQVIIGRTHFFTGDRRVYYGMPVSSVMDAKDLSLGKSSGRVSAVARRRGTSRRDKALWNDGEYGRRDTDYSPWTAHERHNQKNSNNPPPQRLLDD